MTQVSRSSRGIMLFPNNCMGLGRSMLLAFARRTSIVAADPSLPDRACETLLESTDFPSTFKILSPFARADVLPGKPGTKSTITCPFRNNPTVPCESTSVTSRDLRNCTDQHIFVVQAISSRESAKPDAVEMRKERHAFFSQDYDHVFLTLHGICCSCTSSRCPGCRSDKSLTSNV